VFFSSSAWLQRSVFAFFLVILSTGCSAQSPSPSDQTNRRILNQIRSQYSVPPTVEITVGERKPSEFNGYYTLPITLTGATRKTTLDFLLSKDEKTLVRLDKIDLTTDPASKINVAGRPVRGNKDAKVTIVNYDDFQCPFCSRMHETLFKNILATYGDRVKIIYKDYPLYSLHPWASHAAVNANCLNQQSTPAYWGFADYVHYNQHQIMGEKRPVGEQTAELDRIAMDEGKKNGVDAAKLQACVKAQDDSAVKASAKEGEELGVDSTPTLFINGEKLAGAVPPEILTGVIDRALRAEGVAPPAKPQEPAPAPTAEKK
jgi:protein-disulfide isomerase